MPYRMFTAICFIGTFSLLPYRMFTAICFIYTFLFDALQDVHCYLFYIHLSV